MGACLGPESGPPGPRRAGFQPAGGLPSARGGDPTRRGSLLPGPPRPSQGKEVSATVSLA